MFIRNKIKNALAWLLYHANANPSLEKEAFYELKNALLLLHGKPDGYDLQVLPAKECYSCNGTGWYSYMQTCWSCMGSGKYQAEVYVGLNRYTIGSHGYIFHSPVGRWANEAEVPFTYRKFSSGRIHGYIEKTRTPYSTEAKLWLFFLYRPREFRKMLRLHRGFAPMDRGFWVGLHNFYWHCKDEIARRRDHLDFGQRPEPLMCRFDTDNCPF